MTAETVNDLNEEGKELYKSGVSQLLAGFQLIEEMLKSYIEAHFDSVRALINGRLHFDYRRSDYQDAALGRLIQVFSKLCANAQLVSELRALVKRRDQVAHKAFLKLYEQGGTPAEYAQLCSELSSDAEQVGNLMSQVVHEIEKLHSAAGAK